ncbi:PorT family protein [Hymenobacter tibetensis]|uniref:PorT family protein n=1 Tax=Hymenobacter tibetensis TaxID=497967 RepID=A0ABY4CYU1_9BACT|nr:outer membrane beta-barrel protein [Hymenobacter tibetensis]UOG74216.1 PorT family protein [Hymenobacter tibetensis]
MKRTLAATLICLVLLLPKISGYGQHLQAVGVSGSFNIARLHSSTQEFRLGSVVINPQADQSNDETGNGPTVFGRWQVGQGGWYVQPELGHVSALETPVGLTYSSGNFPYSSRRIRRVDIRLLGGYQSGPLRLFAGPSVGRYLRDSRTPNFIDSNVQAAAEALDADRSSIQWAVQAGAGVSLWRLDVNARYEWGLTPYSRTVVFQQQAFHFNRNLQQLIMEVGFQLYKRPLQGYKVP